MMVIFNHYKEDILHECCPLGKGSWCSFQRDVPTRSSFHKLLLFNIITFIHIMNLVFEVIFTPFNDTGKD